MSISNNLNEAPTFLCDEMLKGLARWLRAAGYDTRTCKTGTRDRSLLKQAIEEERLLLTRDRKLLEFRDAPGTVVLLDCNQLLDCIDDLASKLRIDWLYRPFTRCLLCNTPLVIAEQRLYHRIPPTSREHIQQAMYCPVCDKLFWEGSHVHRMRDRLHEWCSRQ